MPLAELEHFTPQQQIETRQMCKGVGERSLPAGVAHRSAAVGAVVISPGIDDRFHAMSPSGTAVRTRLLA